MAEKMTLERLRDWHRRVNKEWSTATLREQMQLVVDFPHGLAATFLDAHITQPAQAVDVDAVRAVIEQTREYYERTDDRRTAYALENVLSDIYENLTAALTRNTQEH